MAGFLRLENKEVRDRGVSLGAQLLPCPLQMLSLRIFLVFENGEDSKRWKVFFFHENSH